MLKMVNFSFELPRFKRLSGGGVSFEPVEFVVERL